MTVLDDPSLIARARTGDAEAYGQLYERHVGVALGVARRITDRDAEDVVSDAFARTFAVLRDGGGPDVAFRPYVLRAVRNAAVDRHRREGRVDPVAAVDEAQTPLHQDREVGDPVVDALERQLAVRAFDSLPERWRTVLWHTEVEGETPAQVAPLLGISPRAVAQLAVRAREGLRTAWLREHAERVPAGHREVVAQLAPSVRSSLGLRGRRALETHLAGCAGCRRVREELVEVNGTLRAAVLPAVLGLTAAQMGWTGPTAGSAAAGAAASGGAGGHGVGAAVSGALSHPVAVGAVAVAVAATGVGGHVLWDSLREPRTVQVATTPAPRASTPTPTPTPTPTSEPADDGATRPTEAPSASAPSTPPESGTGTGEPSPTSPVTSTPSSPDATSSGSSGSGPSCGDGGPPRTPDASSPSGTASGATSSGSHSHPSSSCASSSGAPSPSVTTATAPSGTCPSRTSTSGGTSPGTATPAR